MVKDTSAKLKEASESDHRRDVSVSVFPLRRCLLVRCDSITFSESCLSIVISLFMGFFLGTPVLLQQSKKIADAKLAKDFEAVLREFQKAQRIAAERESSYTPFDLKGSLSSRYRNCNIRGVSNFSFQ